MDAEPESPAPPLTLKVTVILTASSVLPVWPLSFTSFLYRCAASSSPCVLDPSAHRLSPPLVGPWVLLVLGTAAVGTSPHAFTVSCLP